jgi:tRNA (guanine-N7-)-methyltransferase
VLEGNRFLRQQRRRDPARAHSGIDRPVTAPRIARFQNGPYGVFHRRARGGESTRTAPAGHRETVPWRAVFGNDRPVEVEIGCGDGHFLRATAARTPERNFIGLERATVLAHSACTALDEAALPNARVLCCDARCVVRWLIPDRSVAAYHLYFPDPWWKRRHHRRRLSTPAFASDLARTLASTGRVFVATDVADLFDAIAQSLTATGLVRTEPSAFDVETSFAARCAAVGRPIHRDVFVHTVPPFAPGSA